MAIDMNRMAAAALEAAMNGEQPRRRFSGLKAVAVGAALATVARAAAKRAPDIGHMPRLGELGDNVRERLGLFDEGPDEDEDYDDELDEDEEEFDDEPEGEYEDEHWDDEAAEDDEDEDPGDDEEPDDDEPDDDEDPDEDDDYDEDEEPEPEHSSAPPIARGNGRHVDPAARPPKPPEQRKSKAGRS